MTTKISGLDVQTAPLYDLCCPVTFETGLAVSSGRAVGCAQPTCLWVSWAVCLGGSCSKTTACSEMSFQGIFLADFNATGQGVSTGLKCFGSDVTASLLELSVQ